MRLRLSLLMFLQYAPAGAVLPQFSLHLKRLGFSPRETAVACTTQAIAFMVSPLFAGQVADRWLPSERCLFACAVAAGILLEVLAALTTPVAVFVASLALWLVLGPAITLGTTLSFTHLAQPEQDFGRVRLWGTVGWVVPNWLLGYWFSQPGWAVEWLAWLRPGDPQPHSADAFRLAAILAFTLAAYALTLPHTPPQRRLGAWLAPLAALHVLRDRSFAVFAVGSFGVSLTLAVNSQTAPLLLEHLALSDTWLLPTLTIAQSTEVLFLALLPMLLLRLETRGTMLFGLAVWLTGLSVMALGTPTWLVIAALGAWGTCVCCYLVAGQVYVNSRARGDIRTSAQALLTGINALGMLTGNLLAGEVRAAAGGALGPVYAVATAVAAAVTCVFLLGFRQPNRA